MIDPVSSFAIAGNVLQFAELAVKLVSKSAEYAVGGGSEHYTSLHSLIERLAASNAHLQSSLDQASLRTIQPGPERALHLANEECLRVSKEFTAFLSEFKINDSRVFWSSRECLHSLPPCISSYPQLYSKGLPAHGSLNIREVALQ